MREVVDLDPPYQRESGVWGDAARSMLIDSIINGLDIPKLYFEALRSRRLGPEGLAYQYAVIDGKQRLETILGFLADEVSLPEDFIFFEDDSVNAERLTLSELRDRYPILARRFLDFELPIVEVVSDSGDLIEEMFQRLNASMSLNAAERRNALQGPTRDAANSLAEHRLLVQCSPIRSARYKYRELGAKFLAIEQQIATRNKISDTKAATLYNLFTATRGSSPRVSSEAMEAYRARAEGVLDGMVEVFDPEDRLLASIGTVVVYYLAFRDPRFSSTVGRMKLVKFEELRHSAAQMPETDPEYATQANSRLREYNGLVQSTNDGSALHRRAEILSAFVLGYSESAPLNGLELAEEGELPLVDESDEV
ncbi:DUF262 domain-containing protein [Pseudoclavibacter sp. CFCC 13796]|uniref:DUF262 domain-containing protein n=1 Tax=Pseudoclavibacter sp. CFCC 13796 TaxID=2615179 RepID=UPI00130138A1|nr:DUF262 domain-containing protein [Pseudoclavibacter sp. CFCC 13796]KAB1661660.1 DUF262 domain-containing protein [Pseudoclavibacter sp. CFCC 13796]